MKQIGFVLAAIVSAVAFGDIERVGSWSVRLPAQVLTRLPMAQRNCAERAERQTESGSYRAAAAEWARFDAEYVSAASEATLAWAMTLRARCLERAHDVNQALEIYGDEIELYPDQPATACALYWRAEARAGNGDTSGSAADIDAVVANDSYASSPVRYAAMDLRARRFMKLGNVAAALAGWQKVVDSPRSVNEGSWNSVRERLTVLDRIEHPEKVIAGNGGELRDISARIMRGDDFVAAYFNSRRGAAKDWRAAASEWQKKVEQAFVARLMEQAEKSATAAEREKFALRAVSMLSQLKRIDEAKAMLANVADPVKRAFSGAQIGWAAGDGKFVVFSLADAESSPDAEVAERAKREHAWACQRLLREYDAAIKLYTEAPNPPDTLWRIAECERSAGRAAKAQGVLDEICGVFPDDAAAAMLRKGDWYRDDGDKKRAIGCYRRILSQPDWKKSSAASQAHQRLEAYGIATGGAVGVERE